MKSIIAIANQKGGVGKTTSAAALAVLLSRTGQRVHVVDMDPQASLTSAFGMHDSDGLLFQALKERKALPIVRLSDKLTLTPSSIDLARAEADFLGEAAREYILQTSLEQSGLPDETLVLLDCPPSLGLLAVNCLAAADKLLVVVHPGGFELRALVHLQDTVRVLKERVNPELTLIGAVLTKCDMRKKITELVRQEVSRVYDLLGVVRSDAQLQYACSDGTMLELKTDDSHALAEYAGVAERLTNLVWKTESSPA